LANAGPDTIETWACASPKAKTALPASATAKIVSFMVNALSLLKGKR